jgi:RNA polymerase sigma-70 factor (ECF subfamily)
MKIREICAYASNESVDVMSSAETPDPRLSRLATPWTALGQAHSPDADSRLAQAKVLYHYRPALLQYLNRLVNDAHLAEDLCQEFALRFLRGDFRQVRPERGRFRDYLRAALRNLVNDYYRRKPPSAEILPSDSQLPVKENVGGPGESSNSSGPDEFGEIWKNELMRRAWADLRTDSTTHGNLYYDALRLKADDPSRRAEDIAVILSERTAAPCSATTVRQLLHRGRDKFAAALRRTVREALPTGEAANVDDELADLGLLVYVTPQKR